MIKKIFTVESESFDPYENLALEEHLLRSVLPGSVILYLWQNAHTVVIGCNQNCWAECRVSVLQEEGGHLARRLSGGGAVYHDLGNLNFTFLCREEDYDLQKQLSVIQRACALTGISATFSGRNDLLADGRKFSGNAFYHSHGMAYHHGTLLVDVDTQKMSRYLSPPKAKLEAKGVSSVRSRVVNLKELSPELSCARMKALMTQAFCQIYGQNAERLTLDEADREQVALLRSRYGSEEWLYGKIFPFTCQMETHFPWGHLQLQLQVEQGTVRGVQVYTDAMDADLSEQLRIALTGCPFRTEAMCKAVEGLPQAEALSRFFATQQL